MWRNFIIFLLFFSCVLALVAVTRRLEAFTIDDNSMPAIAYRYMGDDDLEVARKPFLEFNDRFFLNTLTTAKSTNAIDEKGWILVPTSEITDTQKKGVCDYIEGTLNRALHPNDPNLFHVVQFEAESLKHSQDKKLWTIQSRVLVHRTGKAYGASLALHTLHDVPNAQTSLVGFKMIGFVFEDKVSDDVRPGNYYGEDDDVASVDMLSMRILANKSEQDKLVCKQLRDMKATRGVDYTSLFSEKMNCDG